MKLRITLIFLFAAVLKFSAQQFPIQVTTVIPPPYPQTWEESIGLGNNAFIILSNTSPFQTYAIKLTAKITSDNGISVEVLPEATPIQPIVIAPGQTRTVFGAELEALYLNYGESDITYSGVDAAEVINNPYLPEGSYTYCIKAFDYNTNAPLSNELTSGCAAPIYVTTISPPIITYPLDEQDLNALTPQQIVFNWTPVTYNSPNVRYAFQMVDYTDLNVNVYDLLNENDFQFFSQEDIIGNTLIYGPDKPTLLQDHDYAVRVLAYLLDGELNIENGGFSDIVRFHYDGANNPFNPWDNIGDIINPIDIDVFDPPNITGGNLGGIDWGNIDLDDLLTIDEEDYETIDGSGDTSNDNPPLITEDLGCGAGCNSVTIDNQTPAELEVNTSVNIGKFQMNVAQVSGTVNGGYSGYGFINVSNVANLDGFFPYPVKVNFTDLSVNTVGQIISGTAIAEQRDGSWLKNSWNNIEKKFDEDYFGDDPDAVYNNIMDPTFRLETWNDLSQAGAITLPAGYGEGDYQVQITEMTFGHDQAKFDAMVLIPIPEDMDGTKHLIFAASDICISPSGPSIGNSPAQLSLSQTVRYRTSDDFAIEINAQGNANLGEGTLVELDCNGFFRANISGQVIFSPDFLVIEKENGDLNTTDTLSAAFTAEFDSWDSWVGELSFIDQNNSSHGKLSSTRFQYTGLDGYTFKMDYAKFDHDIATNLPGMSFPNGYAGSTTHDWQGLFVNEMEVLLPKWAKDDSNDERISILAQTLIIDGSGLSGQFDGTNLAELEDASLGGWDFSIAEAHLKIVSNSFQQGDLAGQLKLPITDDPLNYTANIQHTNNTTQHNFVVSTTEEIDMPAFLADLTLAPNCSISVEIQNGDDVQIESLLHGHLDLPDIAQEIPGCNIENIAFQDMAVRNYGEMFEIGSFGSEEVSSSITVASVAVGLAGLAMSKIEGAVDEYELGFDLDFQLGENNAGVSGTGKMFLVAQRLGLTPEDFDLTYDRTGIDAFQVEGDLPGVNVNATVAYFDNATLGHGFAGEFQAEFVDAISVQATAMFGIKEINNSTKKFFMIEGMGTLPTGFPLAPPVNVYGFGGGLYYNIKPSNNFEVADLEENYEAPNPEDLTTQYVFEEGLLGLKAACVIGLTPPDVFNADVGLTVFVDTDDFSIESMNLAGSGYMMTKLTDRSNPLMNITAEIDYNFSTEILHGEMAMDLSAPAGDDPLITANGTLKIHVGDYWYVKFGEPATPVHGLVDLKVLEATLDTYFMTGQNLPAPIIPENVTEQFPDYTPVLMGSATSSGTGVAMGVHARVVSEIDVIVAYMNLDVGAGFDFTAMSYSNSLCNGSSEFGINQWYANVQGYVYGDISFTTLDYEWLSINAGLIVEGALPNPTGFQGQVHFTVETFLKDFSVHDDFSIGEICQMQTILNEDGEVVVTSSPIQELSIIKNVNPGGGDSNVDLFTQPKVQFHIDPNENMIFDYPLGNGQVAHEEIFFERRITWTEKINGNDIAINHSEDWDEASKTYTYTRVIDNMVTQEIASPNTQHHFFVEVIPKNDGEEFTDEDSGLELKETHDNYYTTAKNINSIDQAHIDFCRPYRRQRYTTIGDYNNALVRFNVSYSPAFAAYENEGYAFQAKIYKQGVTSPVKSDTIDYSYDLLAFYDISDLEPETTYKVVFTASKEVELEVNDYTSSTDTYNDASGINVNTNNYNYADNSPLGDNNENNSNSNSTTPATLVLDQQKLFTYFFRTSKYNTLQEKIDSYTVVNTSVETRPTNFNSQQLSKIPAGNSQSNFYNYNSINIELAGGEPFDEFDLFAPPITLINQGFDGKIISFAYLGSSQWYSPNGLSCEGTPIFNGPPGQPGSTIEQNDDYANLQRYDFKSQFGGDGIGYDLEYIGVSKPLSDSELQGSTGSTQNSFGQLFNNIYSNINMPNDNLTLIYRGDLGGKEFMCDFICEENNNSYQFMQSGNYIFKMSSKNVDMHADTPTANKTFTINLQMP